MIRRALGVAALVALASVASAAVMSSGIINLAIPNTSAGLYVNVQDGTTYTGPSTFPTFPGPGANYDINIFGTSSWTFFSPTSSGMSPATTADQRGYVASSTSGPASVLNAGDVVGPASVLNTGSPSGSAFLGLPSSYLGFRFRTEPDLAIHYGWARISIATGGTPGVLHEYAWESTAGAPITVPEPASALLSLVVLALRRR